MTISLPHAGPASGRLRTLLRSSPLTSFFVLSYTFSWLVSLPYILSVWGVVPNTLMAGFMLKQWVGPALAAMVMAVVTGGRSGLRELRAAGRAWRVGWQWYAVVLVGAPLLILAGVLAVFGVPTSLAGFEPGIVASYLGYFVLVFFAVGLPEELGWRGFALPRLQARFGPLRGTLILGVLWAGWHLPFFLTPDHGGGPQADVMVVVTNFALFAGMVVLMAVPFSFVYNATRGSVFMAALLHAAIDTPQVVWLPLLLPVGIENSTSGEGRLSLALLLAFGVVASVIVAVTKGRLGWAPPHGVGTGVSGS
ncbi:MAG TPA: type II CAAX endopeptidase family protein [Propionicimonas sp.]|jgi:membrane protease YdiL (CAAX protease family)